MPQHSPAFFAFFAFFAVQSLPSAHGRRRISRSHGRRLGDVAAKNAKITKNRRWKSKKSSDPFCRWEISHAFAVQSRTDSSMEDDRTPTLQLYQHAVGGYSSEIPPTGTTRSARAEEGMPINFCAGPKPSRSGPYNVHAPAHRQVYAAWMFIRSDLIGTARAKPAHRGEFFRRFPTWRATLRRGRRPRGRDKARPSREVPDSPTHSETGNRWVAG